MQDLETLAIGLTSGSSFSSSSCSSIVVGPIPSDLWNARFEKLGLLLNRLLPYIKAH
jgi:hypothetical protein